MLNRFVSHAASGVLAFSLCMPVLHAEDKPSSIDQLAPENSVLVIGAKSFSASMERFKSTRLWDFWQSTHADSLRKQFDEGMKEALQEIADELEMKPEDVPLPTGAAGFALFSVVDEDTGMPMPGVFLYADFGDEAEKMYTMVQTIIEKGETDGKIRSEVIELVGREGWSAEIVEPTPADDAGADEAEGEEDWMMEEPSGPTFKFMHLVKEGSMLMISSDKDALEQALHARDGKDITSVGDRDDHKAIKDQVGEGEIYGALLMRDFWQTIGAMDGGGMTMFIAPMIEQVFGKVDGAGWTIALDTATAMVEQTWFIHMPQGKSGLLGLIGAPTDRPTVPSFVSPDSTAYFSINVNAAGVAPFVREQLRTFAEMQGGMDQQQMEQIERQVAEVFATMGDHLHIANRINKPLAADSSRMMIAMECKKPQDFENLIAQHAPAIGMESRDFLGQRIYTMDMGGMGNAADAWSMGIGGGFVIIGPSSEVEIALRAANEKETTTLESHADFKRIVSSVGSEKAVVWGFIDIVENTVANARMSVLNMRATAEEIREFAPEYADELLAEAKKLEESFGEMPSAEVLRQYVGPAAWHVRSIDAGFVGKSIVLPSSGD